MPPSTRPLLHATAVAAAALVAFLPSLRGGFLWDDHALTENPLVASASGLAQIWLHPSRNTFESHYWPMVYSGFWIEHKLWGFAPAGYRAVNLLLHAANALLVMLLFSRVHRRAGLAAGLLFALHPVHAESVAWVIERKDVLSGLFYWSAALAFLRHADRNSAAAWWVAFLLFVCAMLSKSVAVTWPVAMLLWRVAAGGPLSLRAWLPRLAPMIAAAMLFAWLDSRWAAGRGPYESGLNFIERFCLASRAVWFYLGKSVWPAPLAAVYPRWAADGPPAWAWIFPAAGAGLIGPLLVARHSRVVIGAAAAFFVVTLAPTLGWIDFSFMRHSFVADRFQYLALTGPAAALVWVLGRARLRSTYSAPKLDACFALVLLAALTFACWRGALRHADQETLFEATLRVNMTPSFRATAARAFHNLGQPGVASGEPAALQRLRRAMELEPDSPLYAVSLGRALLAAGDAAGAEAALTRALELKPDLPQALAAMAELRLAQGRADEAAGFKSRAEAAALPLRLAPLRLGLTKIDPSDPMQARNVAARARATPDDPSALYDVAVLHFMRGEFAESRAALDRVCSLDPGRAESWFLLGLVHLGSGADEAALAAFHEAFNLRPAMRELLEALKTGDDVRSDPESLQ